MAEMTKGRRILRWLKRIGIGLGGLLVVLPVAGIVYEQLARHRAARDYPPRGQMVDIGGRRIHIDCRGRGSPTVIFESGLGTTGSLSWDRVHDAVARTTRACAYDRAGLMWSDPTPGGQDAEHVSDDLHATLKAAGITVIHTRPSVRHSLKAEKIGCDAVSVDGFECGGHPGEDDVPNFILLPRAAEELNVTHGAVSRHVKALETHLGVALFRRLTRRIVLTGAGSDFLPVVARSLAAHFAGSQ